MSKESSIKISTEKWSLIVDTNGGRIVELRFEDKLILGTFTRIDGKIGNTHICCPNFGNEGMEKYGLPFHGPGRNQIWQVKSLEKNKIMISTVLKDMGSYPTILEIKQLFELKENEFSQNIRIKNIGEKAAPVNVAIHDYWNSPNGWEKVMINGINVSDIVKQDAFCDIKTENRIEIPGLPPIQLKQQNMPCVRLWSGRVIRGETEYDKNYVCIEPAGGRDDKNYFGSQKSIVEVGETVEYSQTIGIDCDFI